MFIISASTFGGGFVIVSLMKEKFVEQLGWIEEDEMLDIAAISQSSPGPIPVNASVILGYRMAGVKGSLIAVLGTIIPPVLIITLISIFYTQFKQSQVITVALQITRAGVAAVIFDVVCKLAKNVLSTKSLLYIPLMIISFLATYFFGISAFLIIPICLCVGIINLLFTLKKGGAKNK